MLCVSTTSMANLVDVRILSTTDLHSHAMDYDYYQAQSTESFGLTRTATLIKSARSEVKNALLVDNGDLIQGSPLGDYQAAIGLGSGKKHPMVKAMNALNYTVGTLGNHEFNYGLDYLKTAIAGANFPYVNANVIDLQRNEPFITPWVIKPIVMRDRDNRSVTLKVGFIGFVPPQIMTWDALNLRGKVRVDDIVTTARREVANMRRQGADLVVVLSHSGISTQPWQAMAENVSNDLSEVEGIDAIVAGHAHAVFPSPEFAHVKGADVHQGTINGIPLVMAGRWGSHLGVIDLTLDNQQGTWQVVSGRAEARPIYATERKQATVKADSAIATLVAADHEATRRYVEQPVGQLAQPLYSYLSLLQNSAVMQIVSDAQRDFVKQQVQNDPTLSHLPILSVIAPFKAGGRHDDPNGYIKVDAGTMSLRNIIDLYIYPNTLSVVKADGRAIKEWLECAAGQFNQIDVHNPQPQSLINWAFRTYNFDNIAGLTWAIDVTQPAKYDTSCRVVNPQSARIVNLAWQGKPIEPTAQFLLATNNYRAGGGGNFPGTGAEATVFTSAEPNRDILVAWVRQQTKDKQPLTVQVVDNWRIQPITSDIALDIRFETAPGAQAARYIQQHARYAMTYTGESEHGYAVWNVDLQHPRPAQ